MELNLKMGQDGSGIVTFYIGSKSFCVAHLHHRPQRNIFTKLPSTSV